MAHLTKWTMAAAVLALVIAVQGAAAVETEHLNFQVLPAPGKVAVDGNFDDWDLTGGIFACGDPETLRDKYALWFHAMYDADNLYILARWIDETPMNNPGSVKGDFGFAGDCLQFRAIVGADVAGEKVSHWTCWIDRDGIDAMQITYGRDFKGGNAEGKKEGCQQAFRKDADGKGYVQEMAIPWKLLTGGGPLKAGEQFQFTIEPNFGVGKGGRMTIKDVFKAGMALDKVFTFRAYKEWGLATLEKAGKVELRPVRLADGREFPVKLANGVATVDWKGLVVSREPAGFKSIKFTMPQDGYASIHLVDGDGQVVRQLLDYDFRAKGECEIQWDGLGTGHWTAPGPVLPAGQYTWRGIYHTGIGLRLRGWAANAGSAPWDNGPNTNWGGDHGVPASIDTDGEKMYLGWTAAEAGKAVVATDLEGGVKWRHIRGGMGGAELLSVDGGTLYVLDGGSDLYLLDAKKGAYVAWQGSDSASLSISTILDQLPVLNDKDGNDVRKDRYNWGNKPQALLARGGKVYLGFAPRNVVVVLDGKSGQVLQQIPVPAPSDLAASADGKSLFVLTGWSKVAALDVPSGKLNVLVDKVEGAKGLAIGPDGKIYVSVGDPDNQVKVFGPDGKPAGEIGRKGGRALLGPWQADGMAFAKGIRLDKNGKLWVMEGDNHPKRVSVWNLAEAAGAAQPSLYKELLGPTHYGASGGAIAFWDANIMVGEGCEWRIDPATGHAVCLGVFDRTIHSYAKFCRGANGKIYLAAATGGASPAIKIFERLGDGQYALRARLCNGEIDNPAAAGQAVAEETPAKGAKPAAKIPAKLKVALFWADRNGDGNEQADEVTSFPQPLTLGGYYVWSVYMNQDLTLYASADKVCTQIKVGSFTPCGAPLYDLANARSLGTVDGGALSSLDNRIAVTSRDPSFQGFDVASGKLLWSYPNTFSGVHGSHAAPPPEAGLIRGAFGVVGTGKLPAPIGDVFAINTNVGEWHLLTGDGFYLARLFQGDQMKIAWPDKAEPGAIMDNVPPGMGAEDFGGSMVQGADGKLYIAAGKTALWNLEVVGLETVKTLGEGTVKLEEAELAEAARFREQQLQSSAGSRVYTAHKLTPKNSGNLDADFKGAEVISFKKADDAAVKAAAAWDDQNLYLGFQVKDSTPWINGADAPQYMYTRGDTVDFQIGVDPNADKKRTEAGRGDLRLSIGNFQGKPTAVIYRKVADVKKPMTFSSGVVKEYIMDSVIVLEGAAITVKTGKDSYTLQAAIPLAALGLKPSSGLTVRGDFGVTHSDAKGADAVLRTYWANQQTGLVSDDVFELKMEPKNWGEIIFRE